MKYYRFYIIYKNLKLFYQIVFFSSDVLYYPSFQYSIFPIPKYFKHANSINDIGLLKCG